MAEWKTNGWRASSRTPSSRTGEDRRENYIYCYTFVLDPQMSPTMGVMFQEPLMHRFGKRSRNSHHVTLLCWLMRHICCTVWMAIFYRQHVHSVYSAASTQRQYVCRIKTPVPTARRCVVLCRLWSVSHFCCHCCTFFWPLTVHCCIVTSNMKLLSKVVCACRDLYSMCLEKYAGWLYSMCTPPPRIWTFFFVSGSGATTMDESCARCGVLSWC